FALASDSGKPAKGEAPPEQQSADDMQANRVEAFIDGLAYFGAIDDEIDALINSNTPDRYFHISAWVLGLVAVKRTVNIRSIGSTLAAVLGRFTDLVRDWTIEVDEAEFIMPKSKLPLLKRLTDLSAAGVDVRVLAWSSPFLPKYQKAAEGAPG